jgi:hypothetical protein
MGLPIVTVAADDRARGVLAQASALAIFKALHDHGVVILRELFSPEAIEALHGEFAARYGNLDAAAMLAMSERPAPNPVQKNGNARFEVVIRMTGGFGQPSLFANPLLITILGPMLGDTIMRLASMSAVVSFPGAQPQHTHRDNPQLYEDFPQIGVALPAYAVTAAIPLIDVDHAIGPTAFWLGSHRWKDNHTRPETAESSPFLRGDCLLVDTRTIHSGMANASSIVRPILYMMYCREWFTDDCNHRQRLPLNITLEEILALPGNLQPLMLRALQQAVRIKAALGQ